MNFNIFAQLKEELDDFLTKKIKIGGGDKNAKRKPYEFSQNDTVEVIDYYTNSKFELGDRDSDGQQKFFINEVSFRKDVAVKNIDKDVKNYSFIPEEDQAEYGAIFLRKMFRKWTKKSDKEGNVYGEIMNEMVESFCKYGSVVVKKVGKNVELVPLQKLRNDPRAKSLKTARYVILEHSGLNQEELSLYPDWDISQLDLKWNSEVDVYERYGFVPLDWYKEYKKEKIEKGDDTKSIKVVAMLAPDADAKTPDGKVLFCEEADSVELLEAHYERQYGRWLGIGEVEKQFENQKIRNMVFNLRKKNLAWSAKQIYQTQDDILVNSLVREVKDGDVLKISTPNGIMRVDTTDRASGDFNSIDTMVTENANQRSFSFEVATGEQLKSNTPFRLGALQSAETDKYFSNKTDRLSFLFIKVITEFLIPQFEKSIDDEETVAVFANDEEFDKLRARKTKVLQTRQFVRDVINEIEPDVEQSSQQINEELSGKDMDTYTFTREDIKNLKYTVVIEVNGESIDLPQKMETLVNLYTALSQAQDPRAELVLKKLLSIAGERLPMRPQTQAPAQMPNMENINAQRQTTTAGE